MYVYIKEKSNRIELINKEDKHKWINILKMYYKIFLNRYVVKKIDNTHYLYIVPKTNNIKKIRTITRLHPKDTIILSKDLKKYEPELGIKTKENIMFLFLDKLLEYILDVMEVKLELQNVYVCANQYNTQNIDIIKGLINKTKTLTVVTNELDKYGILENNLSESGNLLTITNNRKKALRKANFIINLDFNSDYINKYKINKYSIILNCSNNKINIEYFQGIIVNNIQIDFDLEDNKYEMLNNDFDNSDIYLTCNVKNAHIKTLIGSSGDIDLKEFKNIKKNLILYQKNLDKL